MKIKTLLIAGAFAASFMAPDYATAQPKPKKPKPDFTGKKEDAKDDAKEGGKGKPKFDIGDDRLPDTKFVMLSFLAHALGEKGSDILGKD